MSDLSRLPGPVSDRWEWQLQGLCRSASPSQFFHPDGERGPRRIERDRRAQAICARCPVIAPCAAHALRVREVYGVWGGLTEDDREAIFQAEAEAAVAV